MGVGLRRKALPPSCQPRPNQCPVAQPTNGTAPKKVTASNQNVTKKAVKSRPKKWSDQSKRKSTSAKANTRLMPASTAACRQGQCARARGRRKREGSGMGGQRLGRVWRAKIRRVF